MMGELNTKSQKIIFTIQCSIKSDANEFRKWANDRAAKYVFDLKEEKTISYEWYLSDDNSEATLVESFIDSDGAMQRLNNHMSSPIAEEVMEHVDIKEWLVFGNSKQDLIDALTPFGAKFKKHHSGFNHSSE
jgi:quinol monooxygenase YgiN